MPAAKRPEKPAPTPRPTVWRSETVCKVGPSQSSHRCERIGGGGGGGGGGVGQVVAPRHKYEKKDLRREFFRCPCASFNIDATCDRVGGLFGE